MDIRSTIDLLEAKSKQELTQTKLSYNHGALSPVLTKSNIDFHYSKLYKGYVDRYNRGEGDPAFNEAGAFLHDIWFTQLRSPKTNKPTGKILNLIDNHFGDYVAFKQEFKTEAMKIQGSGWIYLARNGQIKTIKNHQKRTDIVLLVDMWEHSYQQDYGSDKSRYLDNLWRIINWDTVNQRV